MASEQEAVEEEQTDEAQQVVEQNQFETTEEQSDSGHIQMDEPEEQQIINSENHGGDKSGFIHGLAVGFGIGCIAAFVIVWIAVFFTPLVPHAVTYENLLSVFIYPLIYLLAIGLVALTAGVVRQYYSKVR
jgi:fructose-specific phosphotransferase system IIC component